MHQHFGQARGMLVEAVSKLVTHPGRIQNRLHDTIRNEFARVVPDYLPSQFREEYQQLYDSLLPFKIKGSSEKWDFDFDSIDDSTASDIARGIRELEYKVSHYTSEDES